MSPNAGCEPWWHKADQDQLAFREVLVRILAENRCPTGTSMRSGSNELPPAVFLVSRISLVFLWVHGLMTIAHHQAARLRDDATDRL